MIDLALDLAGCTGYAIRYEDESLKTGLWILNRGRLTGKRNPIPMVRLWKRLRKLSEAHDIFKITFEETFARGNAKYRLDSLQHAVILWCVLNDVIWQRVSPPEWKKSMLGDGIANREKYSQMAIERWPDIPMWKDDQCAAMWLLAYSEKEM